ncbi:tRNA (guanosine(37)-N1)-methyltransferase TrmD [Arthrobacter sp. A5]|uniref:tRNA (guanosine(37)-N1)-methyltransferase TrmD n=1 Tax=Arthrobacter sp. A5 TaxID=576926 RepID=UPI003DA8570F
MRVDVISIFPEYLAPLELSLIGKARQDGILDLRVHNLRDFTTDRHRTVDDTPYGGGAGMVMKPEPWALALESVAGSLPPVTDHLSPDDHGAAGSLPPVADHLSPDELGESAAPRSPAKPTLIVPSPAGEVFDQALAYRLAEEEHLVFACGRYEGIDERVLEWAAGPYAVRPVSLGDYVLNGGEVAVLAMVEAIGRLLPGVIGNPESLVEESHADGLLEYPVYTKPSSWRGRDIPDVLLSGNHGRIASFRRDEQLRRTVARRPDLIAALDPACLSKAERATLSDLGYVVVGGRLSPAACTQTVGGP